MRNAFEKTLISPNIFRGKRVWLSGHTGFKGGWLAVWLTQMGAIVTGFSLAPTSPFFSQLKLKNRIRHEIGDIRNLEKVKKSIIKCRPDFVFHLAAQPIIRKSYLDPLETYKTNTLGTLHVLEALRGLDNPCAAVFITTDKVYRNDEKKHAFKEDDPLGGKDPYSASKAAAEILINSYRNSFFQNHLIRIASARAANVIGGGDYSDDRIIPDAFRSLRDNHPILVRNPYSIRPWQHVLEPLSGYLILASSLIRNHKFEGAYNFGPSINNEKTVSELMFEILKNWKGSWRHIKEKHPPHEDKRLQINNDKSKKELRWRPRLSFSEAVRLTMEWYQDSLDPNFDAYIICQKQIKKYEKIK